MKRLIFLAIFGSVCLSGCNFTPSADEQLREKTEQAMQQAIAQLGMPAIVNFQEKRMLKQIYEMRDTSISTQSYIVNEMKGCLVYLGPSIGFGIPYGTQYSNPMKDEYNGRTLPQAEPNGLYMPDTAEGTWVLLKDPASKDVKPVYIEPRVIVSPFRLTGQECT